MAESTTRERTEQTFKRAEQTLSGFMDNHIRTMQSMVAFNRQTMGTSYELTRTLHEESLKMSQVWLDQVNQFQKNYIQSLQSYTHQLQDYGERTFQENQERIEETMERTMELVTPASARSNRRK